MSYESAAGKRYRVRYRKPDHSQTRKNGFKTKREAELFLAENEVSMARGQWIDESHARVTVGTLAAGWLQHQTHLKPSSLDPIQRAYRLHVAPLWAERAVGGIRPSEVQAWVTELNSRKNASVVLRAHGVLASILDSAVADRRMLANPARGVNLPRKTPKRRVYLAHEQVDRLAAECGQNETLVLFLAYTGLRWGEAIGMRVGSLDTLRRRVLVQVNAPRVGGRIVIGTPKGHEARSVPYPSFFAEPLARFCEGKSREQLVFGDGNTHLGTPSSRDGWYEYAIRRLQKDDPSFPRITLHDLRHTAASLAISAGANVKAVQRMLGHKSAAMTLDTYADLFDDDLDAVADALDQARSRSRNFNAAG
ncbi:site-specific integrase [Subtercola endophyticus]|nr:site-specific integrase [Subtercola endophyticus]